MARPARTLARLIAITGAAIVLLSFGITHAASSGPASGGNTLTITGTGLGNGSDITNVTVCGVPATIQSQTANSVTVVVGSASDGGTGDINVYSASIGVTTFTNGYTYNPPGAIFGSFMGWSSISNLPRPESVLAAASVNGKIYAIGGSPSPYSQYSSVYAYDPTQPSSNWLSVSNLPTARDALGAASVNGKIYAIGGHQGYNTTSISVPYVSVYDPSQPTLGWLNVSNLPFSSTSTAVSANGKIYAIGVGGINVFVYDPSQPTLGWLSVSQLPVSLEYLAAASVNGKIYAIGGYDTYNVQSTVYVYDPSQPTQGWLSTSNLPVVCQGMATTALNGKIYVIGGNVWSVSVYSTVYEESFASGVVPSSGPLAGGNTVTISGNNLGNGDVTNVTLCGIPATIVADYSPTQLVVTAGAAAIPTNADVVVCSTSCGITVKSDAYTYLLPTIMTAFDGTNLQLSWPTNCLGWLLEAQTNPPGMGLGANWFPVVGSTVTNQFLILINPANGSVFYRLHQQ